MFKMASEKRKCYDLDAVEFAEVNSNEKVSKKFQVDHESR